jgi:CheY-like chemotaxis protein
LREGKSIRQDIYFEETPFSKKFYKNAKERTDRKKADARLCEFEKMFDMIARISEVGFFRANILHTDGELYATDQWYANMNVPKDYTMTASSLVPDTIHPEDAAALGRFMADAIEGKATVHPYVEFRVRNLDGTTHWLRGSAMVTEHDIKKGRAVLFGMNIDITATKNIENTLIEARNKAEESDMLKSAFTANMSHESGDLTVESTPGKESRFSLCIPAQPVEDPQAVENLTAETPDGRKPVVLVAEGLKINYVLLSKLLEKFYTVIIAQNGEEAVKAHAEHAPDLILMDLKMPKMDGLKAADQIRLKDTKTPIVAITAFAFDFDRQKAAASGCNYPITKPIEPTQLLKIEHDFITKGKYEPKA